jgi:putative aminopeptidase FrvX
MQESAFGFLQQLLNTPSPSGYEAPIQSVVRDYMEGIADELISDVHGNLIAVKNATVNSSAAKSNAEPLRVMFAGHCDQIGLLVTQIDESGFLYTQPIGGWDPMQLIGQRMTIWTDDGPLSAVIARKPIHLLNEEERKQVAKLEDLWLDIGARDKSEAAGLVRIGDPVTLTLGFQRLLNNLANGPGMDNRTGLWVVMEAFRRAAEQSLPCRLYAVSTVQEEIGLRGARTSAFEIDPQVAIAVDVTHATDCPTIDKRQQGEIRLGAGPVIYRGPNMNPVITERLIELCQQEDISYQPAAIGRATPNDANTLQISRAGVATGLVSIPNRYMHSAVETICLDDLDRAADLLAAFSLSVSCEEDFIPG